MYQPRCQVVCIDTRVYTPSVCMNIVSSFLAYLERKERRKRKEGKKNDERKKRKKSKGKVAKKRETDVKIKKEGKKERKK